MDFIQQLNVWAKGDLLQGRWMVAVAVLVLVPFLMVILYSTNVLLRGMLIPVCLLTLMNLGYGGYLLATKLKQLEKIQTEFGNDSQEAMKTEFKRIKADDGSYRLAKPVWALFIVVFIVINLLTAKEYFKGLSIGFAGMFFAMLIIDTFLHNRLVHYIKALQKILDS